MKRNSTYIFNRESRIISQREVVRINSALGGPEIELVVFEVIFRYIGYQHRMKVKFEYDARWRVVGNDKWNYRSIHYSQRAALKEILLLKENAEGLTFKVKENVTA